jgi:hypothetical protein
MCSKFVLTCLKIVTCFLMSMCYCSLGNAFVQLVAILTGRKEREVCTTLDVSHSMNFTALLGSAYCGEHSSCLSQ